MCSYSTRETIHKVRGSGRKGTRCDTTKLGHNIRPDRQISSLAPPPNTKTHPSPHSSLALEHRPFFIVVAGGCATLKSDRTMMRWCVTWLDERQTTDRMSNNSKGIKCVSWVTEVVIIMILPKLASCLVVKAQPGTTTTSTTTTTSRLH